MSRLAKLMYVFTSIGAITLFVAAVFLRVWMPFMWIIIGLSFIFLLIAISKDKKLYIEFFSMRTTKKGMSMGLTMLLAIVALISVNILGARKSKSFDFSIAQINSLSEQSIKLIESLDSPLKIIYFYKEGAERVEQNKEQFVNLVSKYKQHSDQVKLEFIELNEQPALAEKYQVKTGTGVVFVEYKDRKSLLEKIQEQELTGAMVKVLREKEKRIYYITGHGERDLENAKDTTGLNFWSNLLTENRYKVIPLNLNENPKLPEDADIVALFAPESALQDFEKVAIYDYLKRGGSLWIAKEQLQGSNLDEILAQLGLQTRGKYIVSLVDTPIGKIAQSEVKTFSFSKEHAITQPFSARQSISLLMPEGFALNEGARKDWAYQSLITTGELSRAYDRNDFKGDPALSGPFEVAYSVKGKWDENATQEFQVLVFGDADMFGNKLLYQPGFNRDLTLNSAAYLAREDKLISISPKEVGRTELSITSAQYALLFLLLFLGLPLTLLITSIVIWYRRKYSL